MTVYFVENVFMKLHFISVSNGGKDVMKVDDSYLQQPPQHQQVRSWSDQATDVG